MRSTPPPGRTVLLTCAGAGVIGAAALPVWRVGVGWLATALAVAASAAVARSGRHHGDGGGAGHTAGDRAWRAAAGVASLILIGAAALRAAPWLVALCLGTGVALGSYALIGGRTWREIARGAFALMPASPPAIAWAATRTRSSSPAPSLLPRIIAGVLTGLVLLAVFGTLLVNADVAFADLLRRWGQRVSPAEIARALIALAVGLVAAVAAAYLVSARRAVPGDRATLVQTPEAGAAAPARPRFGLGTVEWGIPVAMLDLLFGVFVFVQFTVLFGGDEYVLGPGGPDYAVYARGGFLQLLMVTALTLAVVAVLAVWARRETAGQRLFLRLLAGPLCLLTLVIVASALTRLGLYAQAYGFTAPRLLGYTGGIWLGLVFVLVIVAGARLSVRWLPRAIVGTGVVVLIALAAINPEALMARTHVARLDQLYPLDVRFLESLSADAADEIFDLRDPDGWSTCVTRGLTRELADPDPWYAWNAAREHARTRLAGTEVACRPRV